MNVCIEFGPYSVTAKNGNASINGKGTTNMAQREVNQIKKQENKFCYITARLSVNRTLNSTNTEMEGRRAKKKTDSTL